MKKSILLMCLLALTACEPSIENGDTVCFEVGRGEQTGNFYKYCGYYNASRGICVHSEVPRHPGEEQISGLRKMINGELVYVDYVSSAKQCEKIIQSKAQSLKSVMDAFHVF